MSILRKGHLFALVGRGTGTEPRSKGLLTAAVWLGDGLRNTTIYHRCGDQLCVGHTLRVERFWESFEFAIKAQGRLTEVLALFEDTEHGLHIQQKAK